MTRPPLDAPRWTRVAELFAELTEADPGIRASRLEAIGREDPVLREEVESLLAAHINPGLLGTLDDRAPAAWAWCISRNGKEGTSPSASP